MLHYERRTCGWREALRGRVVSLAAQHRRFGFRRIHALLRRDGEHVIVQCVHRPYREERLQVQGRRRGKGVAVERRPFIEPDHPNQVWSMDFVSDALEHSRRLKCLTVVDDFRKEAVDIVVDHGISGQYVTRVLDAIARFQPLPQILRTDQGPELTGQALDRWAYERGIELRLIEAGKPTQNAFVESFNGKFRDECLNVDWFETIDEAGAKIEAWRIEYNVSRPHQALNDLTPAEYAEQAKHLVTSEEFSNAEI